jgi:hypothetical protein
MVTTNGKNNWIFKRDYASKVHTHIMVTKKGV